MSAERFDALGMAASGADLSLRLKGGTLDIDRLTVTDVAGVSISSVGRVENVFDGPEGEVDISVMAERIDKIAALFRGFQGGTPFSITCRPRRGCFEKPVSICRRVSSIGPVKRRC